MVFVAIAMEMEVEVRIEVVKVIEGRIITEKKSNAEGTTR